MYGTRLFCPLDMHRRLWIGLNDVTQVSRASDNAGSSSFNMNNDRFVATTKIHFDRISRQLLPPGVRSHSWPFARVEFWVRTPNGGTRVGAG